MDLQAFFEGRVFDAYRYFGAHPVREGGVIFRTYAPLAYGVSIIGEFNGWHELPMYCPERKGVYEIRLPEAREGQMYKYVVYGENGRMEHCDPYGFGMELRPSCASIVRELSHYTFRDEAWMERRTRCFTEPMNVFELHLGSFRRREGDAPGAWFHYSEIADELIDYLRKFHFTHVEFMPLAEHPYDGSWGYQQTGFFAPTARYGTATELMELVDRLHQAGFGAILDFVPAHFATDGYALSVYDGKPLYEEPRPELAESGWGTKNFNFSRPEAVSFVQSAAHYWLDCYHFDGLRMDAVSRMVYWKGDVEKGINENGVKFLRNMNSALHEAFPSVMLMAEDSTAYEGCTSPVEQGGLGFDYKWDLGWMHDTLEYFSLPPEERLLTPEKLTFSMHYYYRERHLLPISHDDVARGKRAVADRFYGGYLEKLRQARVFYLYMFLHPGKKLNFMGNELAMFREWNDRRELDFHLLRYPLHAGFARFFERIGELYQTSPALHAQEYAPESFSWVAMGEEGSGIFGIRRSSNGQSLLAIFNFSDEERGWQFSPETETHLKMELHTEWECFGGKLAEERLEYVANAWAPVEVALQPYAGILFWVW